MIKFATFSFLSIFCFSSFMLIDAPDTGCINDKGRVLYDFQDVNHRRTWFPLNDDIMGGLSSGKFSFTKDNTLSFSGKVSLENKGGFASIRSKTDAMDLKDIHTFKLRVKGDGKHYLFNISSSNFVADPGFQARFKTEKDKWQEIEIALNDFSPAFGSRSSKSELDMSKIKIMGLIISDKQAGPFKIEVDWIKAV
jgi:NADH dehydrogenase [ubiquinone] 1 alpha subcomplex assembly factor 1